jgi:hypothetical protein
MRLLATGPAVACGAGVALAVASCSSASPSPSAGLDASADGNVDATDHDSAPADSAASDSSTAEGSSSIDGGAGTAFCAATWGELQAAFEGCCPSGDVTTNDYKFIDAIYSAIVQHCGQAVSSAIQRGRVTFDPAAAQTCEASILAQVAGGWCWPQVDTNQASPPLYATSACSGVVTGLQGAGAPCAVDFECEDGLTCVGWGASNDGTCTTPGAVGHACGPEADAGSILNLDWGLGTHPACASGAYCDGGVCAAEGGAGATCSSDDACDSGMTCHLGVCGTTGPATAGGACDGKVDCQPGLFCNPGDGGAQAGTCAPRSPAGGECSSGSDVCEGYCLLPDGGSVGVCTAVCGSG